MMRIYIPTYRRTDKQKTLEALPKRWKRNTTLVCDKVDAPALRIVAADHGAEISIVPDTITTIAQKRHWIISATPFKKIMMMDDDLRFSHRVYGQNKEFALQSVSRKRLAAYLDEVEAMLDKFVHVGISPRQGNNNIEVTGWKANARMIYCLGYKVGAIRKNCELGRIEHREDMDYTLQLLRKGFANRVLVDLAADQVYNAKGGASEQRSVKNSNKDAEKLARLHPGFVKVVEKEYLASVPRKEVVCYWQKAFASSGKKT